METSKTKELTNFLYTSHTDKGAVRANNEDSSGYVDSVNGHVFVVCDGCGGLPYGERASQTVVNSLKFFFTNYYYKDPVRPRWTISRSTRMSISDEPGRCPAAKGHW